MNKKVNNHILDKANSIKIYLTEIRRMIHQYPELGLHEYETTKLVKRELRNMGVETQEINSEVGALGIIRGLKKGEKRVTALRADIDALPIDEKTNLPYSSKNKGIMHACGHDGHTAMLLGAAKLLNSMKEDFAGIVKLIFQPAEENLNGARLMIEEGVLENPKVDTIVALHCFTDLEIGKVGVWQGPYMASSDRFIIKVMGRGGHGANPHKTIDPVTASAEMILALQTIISREMNSLESAVLSVCTVNGGQTFNVIPDEVTLTGTVRCQKAEFRNIIKEKIERIIKGISEATNCKYSFNYIYGTPALTNNQEVINLITESAKQALGEDSVEYLKQPVMSSEDFSLYLEKMSHGALIRIGNTNPGEDPVLVHTNRFNFNDEALPIGAALLTQFVLNRNH